jgi:hypothetical protein
MADETSKVEPAKGDDDEKEPNVRWVVVAGLGGAVTLAGGYWRFRTGFAVGTLEAHAALGNALAPVVAFLTLLAVVAALWSVQVQRTELALQRRELQETREEMVEQRKQFERTAKAQEGLAEAQREANRLASFTELAQRRANLAQLLQVIATADVALANQPMYDPSKGVQSHITSFSFQQHAEGLFKIEVRRVRELEAELDLVPDDAPESRG